MSNKSIVTYVYTYLIIIVGLIWVFSFLTSDNFDNPIYKYEEFWWYIVIPIAVSVLFFVLKKSNSKISGDIKKQIKTANSNFKKTADKKIKITLDDCDIDHKVYEKEIILDENSKYQERKNIKFSECKIIYTYNDGVKNRVFVSPVMYIELISLRYKLYNEKEFYIYLKRNSNDIKSFLEDETIVKYEGLPEYDYYFDLDFLDKEVFHSPDPTTFRF